jgi:ABC-2 type transport system permease protein
VNPRRLATLTRRIVDQFRHDRRTLALLFVAPIAIMALLGWVVREQNAPPPRVIVANLDGPRGALVAGAIGRSLADAGSIVVSTTSDEAAVRQALADGTADVAIVLPADFADAGRQPSLQIVTAGLNPTAEGSSLATIQQALLRSLTLAAGVSIPSITHATVYGSPGADALDSLAPVFVGFFGYFFVFILTGISFLRERVGGTLERLLATPITRGEIVVGYSLGLGIFATLQVALVLTFTLGRLDVPAIGPLPSFIVGLDVPNAGSPLLAYLLALLLGLGAVSLAIFISTFARTEFQIFQFIPIVIVPQGLLGGFFWPVNALPDVLQPVARVLPITYAVEGLRNVMIGGAGLDSSTVRLDLAVLAAIAGFFVILAAATIRREVA